MRSVQSRLRLYLAQSRARMTASRAPSCRAQKGRNHLQKGRNHYLKRVCDRACRSCQTFGASH